MTMRAAYLVRARVGESGESQTNHAGIPFRTRMRPHSIGTHLRIILGSNLVAPSSGSLDPVHEVNLSVQEHSNTDGWSPSERCSLAPAGVCLPRIAGENMRRFRMLRRGAPASTMCKLLGRCCGTTEEPHRVGVTGHPLKPSGNSLAFRSCPMYQTTAAQHSPYRPALGDITTHTYIRRYRLARSSPVPV
ncbi:hypothetical protein K466DRAFT_258194 [Polyporus arcularius HHB13444]|uniref:Uncharacterized protein n=1 Tax=Polyporus arcularius HHB13444 TaxID=1314778 RepID=A0A5C3P3U2_9APHY|nr:hypothetical protein K466DRAFT_258194 [Polyporus arcularius HHB13444]